jgi:hypothetical protein
MPMVMMSGWIAADALDRDGLVDRPRDRLGYFVERVTETTDGKTELSTDIINIENNNVEGKRDAPGGTNGASSLPPAPGGS